jgi:hypothetical protein
VRSRSGIRHVLTGVNAYPNAGDLSDLAHPRIDYCQSGSEIVHLFC